MVKSLDHQVVAHHLRLVGLVDAGVGTGSGPARVQILDRPGALTAPEALEFAQGGGECIALLPAEAFCAALSVESSSGVGEAYAIFKSSDHRTGSMARLRTLHPNRRFHHPRGERALVDSTGDAAWLRLPVGTGGVLFVGTDLARDLVRYRQGDPSKAASRPTDAMWGIPGERPNYLFEEQLAGEKPSERHADWWAIALARLMAKHLLRPLRSIVPDGAPGAVIITGDDDQAYLEKYADQLQVLGDTPVTYFLHPLTRHNRWTLRQMLGKPWIDLGLHPDALNRPGRYPELLRDQVAWFRSLVGRGPISLRNHGFLNDGYWGHLGPWLDQSIRISSNLPGLDGRVLNGSLLPARVTRDAVLSSHWSLLTSLGDGMRFALGMTDEHAAQRVFDTADAIRQSEIPGVLVLNLHPQNITETRGMHLAAIEVIRSGFHPWTMHECLEWFERLDGSQPRVEASVQDGSFWRVWQWFKGGFFYRSSNSLASFVQLNLDGHI
ncbi:MAG: hypothetical protein ACREX4_01220 [Gammaproteobacteria bacterium]